MSATLAAAITRTHDYAVRVEILRDGALERTLDTVTGGSVTLDAGASIRGRCDVTLVDDGTLVPQTPDDLLAPYGNELRVYRGAYVPGIVEPELVSLGIFRIDDTAVEESGAGTTISLSGLDRAGRIADARFEAPYQTATNANVATAIADVLTQAYPDVQMSFAATSNGSPQVIAEEGSDRWEFAQSLARSAGLRLYFDGDGVAVLAPEVLGGQAVVSLVEGEAGVLLGAGRKWNREGTFNRVIAVGENTGLAAPVRGVATDDNPLSPTYYYGRFGKVPRFYSSPLLQTDEQAADAAQSILARELGSTQSLSFGSLVLPQLEPGDVARITRPRLGIDEDHIIDSLTIPLGPGEPMSGATRAVLVTATTPAPPAPPSGDVELEAATSLLAATSLSAIGVPA